MLEDENVLFYWCMLTTDIKDDKAKILLTMIIDVFITVRGFSFTKSVMELYKLATKKINPEIQSIKKDTSNQDITGA